jgi:hypothetical protein
MNPDAVHSVCAAAESRQRRSRIWNRLVGGRTRIWNRSPSPCADRDLFRPAGSAGRWMAITSRSGRVRSSSAISARDDVSPSVEKTLGTSAVTLRVAAPVN